MCAFLCRPFCHVSPSYIPCYFNSLGEALDESMGRGTHLRDNTNNKSRQTTPLHEHLSVYPAIAKKTPEKTNDLLFSDEDSLCHNLTSLNILGFDIVSQPREDIATDAKEENNATQSPVLNVYREEDSLCHNLTSLNILGFDIATQRRENIITDSKEENNANQSPVPNFYRDSPQHDEVMDDANESDTPRSPTIAHITERYMTALKEMEDIDDMARQVLVNTST